MNVVPASVSDFAAHAAAFDAVWKDGNDDCHESWRGLADTALHFRVAGRRAAQRLLPAFAHLPAVLPEGQPCLTIDAFEAAGHEQLEPLWLAAALRDTADVARHEKPGRVSWLDCGACTDLYSLDDNRVVSCLHQRDVLSHRGLAHPLFIHLVQWMRQQGHAMLHAAVIARAGEGLLLAGRGGAGKSTTLLACLQGGLESGGDDYLALSRLGTPTVYPLYDTVCVHADTFARLAGLSLTPPAMTAASCLENKPPFFMHQSGLQTRPVTRLRAVVAASLVDTGPTRLQPARPGEILRELLTTSLTLPGVPLSDFGLVCDALNGLQCYRLEVGKDSSALLEMMAELLA
jgi:hypothetical protein